MMLGLKQREKNSRFVHVYENIEKYISKKEVDNVIDKSLDEIKKVTKGKRIGYAWSGGKDSIALQYLMQQLRIEDSVIGLTEDLEYPGHLKWVTDNMPNGIEVFNSGHNLEWLSKNLKMLFPKTSNIASLWFKQIQHKAQKHLYQKRKLDLIILGRRLLDANYVGKNRGENIYSNREGIVRYSPIANWSHEQVLGVIRYYNMPHSPLYSWINGYVVGTGCWPARQWTGSISKGWQELYEIDKSIVKKAAKYIMSAKEYLNGK